MRTFDLAQLNLALPREPLDSELLADFVAALGPINALADVTWESLDQLADFVYRSAHAEIMRSRRRWFLSMKEAFTVLWWVPIGHRPTVTESELRLSHLRVHGPSAFAFTLKAPFPPPSRDLRVHSRNETCPSS